MNITPQLDFKQRWESAREQIDKLARFIRPTRSNGLVVEFATQAQNIMQANHLTLDEYLSGISYSTKRI